MTASMTGCVCKTRGWRLGDREAQRDREREKSGKAEMQRKETQRQMVAEPKAGRTEAGREQVCAAGKALQDNGALHQAGLYWECPEWGRGLP